MDENNLTEFKDQQVQDEIGLLVNSFNYMIHRIHELVNTVQRSEIRQKEAAFQALQAQINPHFLYNALETIRMNAEMNMDDKTADISYTLGRMMRYSLSKSAIATLSDEVDNVNNYLNIQKIRIGDRLESEVRVTGDIKQLSCPRFILQPLVENCIIHGVSMLRRKGTILITIQQNGSGWDIVICDNGSGIHAERLQAIRHMLSHPEDAPSFRSQHHGIGISNVSERIKAFFGSQSYLDIHSEYGSGTTIKLHLSEKNGGNAE